MENITSLLTSKFGENTLVSIKENELTILPNQLVEICQFLYENEATYFDMLSCITAIDNGSEKGTMELIYSLYSIPYNQKLTLKVNLPRNASGESLPETDSVAHIWRTANWHEREIFDLMGISFKNHPDLRRILLPSDWEGHPLRKDYQAQAYYHGIKVES
ncbi:MAG: NADH-quinone oxidoreductase subunit C [Pseudarcicella sp.]|nr:NADH-quinone oxidoreductase subunit C [Pseudarcicella sp.]MBP6410636.1 NADH-quinone oxidoreductase subunit C [Pseudarcicella sp.]